MRTFLVFVLLTTATVSAAFAGGLSQTDPEGASARTEASPVRVGLFKGPTGVGAVRLLAQGLELPNGGGLAFELVGSPDVMVSRIVTGEIDAAVIPLNLAAKLYTAGQPIVLAAVVGNGMLSAVSSDPALRSIADMAGRRVHVTGQGSTPDYVLKAVLADARLVPGTDLELDFSLGYPEITASLIAGRVETGVLPEPFATMALAGNPLLTRAVDIQDAWAAVPGFPPQYPMTALVVRRELAETRADEIRTFLSAYRSSIEWVLANPGDAGVLVAEQDLGIPAAAAAAAIPYSAYVFLPANDAETRALCEGLLSVLPDLDPPSIGGRLPDEGFYADFGTY